MDNETRILTNQVTILNALAELLHHTPGGHGELRDALWRKSKETSQHLNAVAAAQKKFGS